MEIVFTEAETKPQTDPYLPWRKPEIERLTISLDTGNELASGPDLATHGLNID